MVIVRDLAGGSPFVKVPRWCLRISLGFELTDFRNKPRRLRQRTPCGEVQSGCNSTLASGGVQAPPTGLGRRAGDWIEMSHLPSGNLTSGQYLHTWVVLKPVVISFAIEEHVRVPCIYQVHHFSSLFKYKFLTVQVKGNSKRAICDVGFLRWGDS